MAQVYSYLRPARFSTILRWQRSAVTGPSPLNLVAGPRSDHLPRLASARLCSVGFKLPSWQSSPLANRHLCFAKLSATRGQRALDAHLPTSALLSLMSSLATACPTQIRLSSSRLRGEVRTLQFIVRLSRLLRLEGKTSSVPLNYDVFLCFRGPDTRTGFANFLYKGLLAAGVSVFWDNDALPFGEQIEKELLQAVRTCGIAIVIISQQFVESRSCNQELTEMMNCHREHGKLVLPIYYKVNHNDIGCESSNEEDILKHEMWYSSEEVQKWREALTSVARIKGWTSQNVADGHEAELVEMVVMKVLSELKMMWINRLPTILRLVYEYILEKKRRGSEWQVFLVFEGQDIEYGLADYLRASLEVAGIRVFSNDDPSLIGKDIAREISNAIDQSRICIAIVNENFYSSSSCLEALARRIESKKTNGQKVYPIFMVQPSQVRYLSLLQQHKDLKGRSNYERWEQALRKLASDRGWVSENIANGKQGELVQRVVEKVRSELNNPQTHGTFAHGPGKVIVRPALESLLNHDSFVTLLLGVLMQ